MNMKNSKLAADIGHTFSATPAQKKAIGGKITISPGWGVLRQNTAPSTVLRKSNTQVFYMDS